jgi:hypothetical protein
MNLNRLLNHFSPWSRLVAGGFICQANPSKVVTTKLIEIGIGSVDSARLPDGNLVQG